RNGLVPAERCVRRPGYSVRSRLGRVSSGSSTPPPVSYHPGRCPGSTLEGSAGSAYPRTHGGRRGRGPARRVIRMRAVFYLAVRELRARWRGWALLVLLVAAAGGAVLAAAGGASRTESAYPRFLTASKASDLLVVPYFSGLGGYLDAVALLPGVDDVAMVASLNLRPLGRGGRAARHALTLVAF